MGRMHVAAMTLSVQVQRTDAHALSGKPSFIDVGSAEIAYHVVGSGPPLLLLHGWPLHGLTFRNLVPTLAARCTCYVVDLPGAGASRCVDRAAFDLRGQAEGLKLFAERLGLASYSILSHDSGGTIGRLLAIIDPDRVKKLVAIGTEIPHHRPPWIRLFQIVSHLPGADFVFRAIMTSDRALRSPLGFGGCFSNLDLIKGDFYRLFVEPLLDSPKLLDGQKRRLRAVDWKLIDDLAEGHARIRAPVLLLWGRDDTFFPMQEAQKMVRQFERCRFVSFPDAKLFVHEEHPHEVARACLDFLHHG